MLITANLSYKMPNISEKDKINVIKKKFFILQFFLCTVKYFSCTLVYTGAQSEDHWFKGKQKSCGYYWAKFTMVMCI